MKRRRSSRSGTQIPAATAAPSSIEGGSQSSGHRYDLRRKRSTSSPCYEDAAVPSTSGASTSIPVKRSRITKSSSLPQLKDNSSSASTLPLPHSSLTLHLGSAGAHYLQHVLPDEVLLNIFSYLSEFDLYCTAQVCKRFNIISNDTELWKTLYHKDQLSTYNVQNPHLKPEVSEFKQSESGILNPWKNSFFVRCSEHITLVVKSQDGYRRELFSVPRNTPLRELMTEYCKIRSWRMRSTRFLFDGNLIDKNVKHTANTLRMKYDFDEIGAFIHHPPRSRPKYYKESGLCHVHVKFSSQDGSVQYTIPKQAPLLSFLTSYCETVGVKKYSIFFNFRGKQFSENDTPSDLYMMDGDVIKVHQRRPWWKYCW